MGQDGDTASDDAAGETGETAREDHAARDTALTAKVYEILRILPVDAGRVVTSRCCARRGGTAAGRRRPRARPCQADPGQTRRRRNRAQVDPQRARRRLPHAGAGGGVSAGGARTQPAWRRTTVFTVRVTIAVIEAVRPEKREAQGGKGCGARRCYRVPAGLPLVAEWAARRGPRPSFATDPGGNGPTRGARRAPPVRAGRTRRRRPREADPSSPGMPPCNRAAGLVPGRAGRNGVRAVGKRSTRFQRAPDAGLARAEVNGPRAPVMHARPIASPCLVGYGLTQLASLLANSKCQHRTACDSSHFHCSGWGTIPRYHSSSRPWSAAARMSRSTLR